MTFPELENWLKCTIGLDAATVGSSSIERGVRERMKAGGYDSLADYWACVCNSPVESQELIDAIVIPETWFFRDAQAFTALANIVQQELLPKPPNDCVRLLSVPCSTGEEPYSMAMGLHAAGMHFSRFRIDAVDISQRSLARAARATYRQNSFRGSDLQFRDKYFEATPQGHVLVEPIRNQVHFAKANLLDDNFGSDSGKYDFIFCRNLLIYFDVPTQARAIATLKRMLADTGYLFVGPSESCVMLNHGFVSSRLPLAFAFQKAKEQLSQPILKKEKTATRIMLPPPAEPRRPSSTPAPLLRDTSTTIKVIQTKSTPDLALARRYADEGKLDEAAAICNAYIREAGASAEAFYLLGLVQDASNCKDQAHHFYRKALYLQPNHYEALVHLALLAKAKGDFEAGRVLQERARRAREVKS